MTQRALREFDRFLDHHPWIEDALLAKPTLLNDHKFRTEHPELRRFLDSNPDTIPSLEGHPRYLLFRALIRQARDPLSLHEIAAISHALDNDPGCESALAHDPELIRNTGFLQLHPGLRKVILDKPELSQAFLPVDENNHANL